MALIYFHLVPCIKVIGTAIKQMEKVHFGIEVVIFIMGNLRMILRTELAPIYIRMALIIRGNGKKTSRRVRVKKNGKMANRMKVAIKMA